MVRWGGDQFIYCYCCYYSNCIDDNSDSNIFRSSSISTPTTMATITVMYLLNLLKSTFISITTNKKTVTNLYPFYHVVIIIPLYYYCSECYYQCY